MREKVNKVVILGAGPAGLTAGWKLAENGVLVTVLEAEDIVGGLCKTVRLEGFNFDLGGHRFITHNLQLAEEVSRLLGDRLEVRPRTSTIRLQGKFFKYPLDFSDLAKKLPPLTAIHCALDYFLNTLKQKIISQSDKSLEDWVVNRFGRALYNIYFGPYSEKLWGLPPSAISADWAAQRISLPNLWDVLLRLLGKKSATPKTYATRFFYPIGGIGTISEQLAERITQAHPENKIILNARVKKIRHHDGRITQVVFEQSGVESVLPVEFVISTIPLPDLINFLEPPLEPYLLAVAQQMQFRALRFLNLMLNMEQVSENCWIYIPEKEYYFFRIQEPKNWHPDNAPAGKTSLILEIACNFGDERWCATEQETANRCLDSLERLGFFVRDKVIGYFSTFARHAYPIYTLDYREKLQRAFSVLQRFDNLVSCGRQGLYRYNNMDHSMEMGILAANYVLGKTPREEIYRVATEAESFEQEYRQAYQR